MYHFKKIVGHKKQPVRFTGFYLHNESEETMKKNLFIIILIIVICCQWSAYNRLHNDHLNLLQAIEEEIL